MELSKTDALQIIKNACSHYVGDLAQHNQVQNAIRVVETALLDAETAEEEKAE